MTTKKKTVAQLFKQLRRQYAAFIASGVKEPKWPFKKRKYDPILTLTDEQKNSDKYLRWEKAVLAYDKLRQPYLTTREELVKRSKNYKRASSKEVGTLLGIQSRSLSAEELLILSNILALKLASDLDAGNTKSIDAITAMWAFMPAEVAMFSGFQVGLERIIQHNLDEYPNFNKVPKRMDRLGKELKAKLKKGKSK